MRELGYRTVDLLVERLQREEPPIRRATPAEMREATNTGAVTRLVQHWPSPQATIAP